MYRPRAFLLFGMMVLLGLGCSNEPSAFAPHPFPAEEETTIDTTPVPFEVTEFAVGLEVPWSIAFTSATRMLVTERPGRVRVIENGVLLPNPIKEFPEISLIDEEGLMSLVTDPDYARNKFVYLAVAHPVEDGIAIKIARFHDDGDALTDEKILLDGIPAAKYHSGCRLGFGPDGMLYISTGDSYDRELAQKLDSLAGKMLRIKSDGTIPADNPYPGSPIWTYGHRNSQGFAWGLDGDLLASEHGPSVIDGPAGGDEINRIIKGANYGWPLVHHDETLEGTIPPLVEFTPAEAPGSLIVYSGKMFPQFKGHLFFGALGGEGLVHLAPDAGGFAFEKLFHETYGRIREVREGPDGSIYFTTSNTDGRGDPADDDDKIFRIYAAPR